MTIVSSRLRLRLRLLPCMRVVTCGWMISRGSASSSSSSMISSISCRYKYPTIHMNMRMNSNVNAAFAGGFGSKPTNSSKKTKSKKKRKFGDSDLMMPPSPSPTLPPKQQQQQLRQLDKWGLPLVPTEDEIFPPMPPGTELIPAPSTHNHTGIDTEPNTTTTTNLQDIKTAMQNHLSLNFDAFDQHGVEINPTSSKDPMKLQLLHQSPPVLCIDNFFTQEECEHTKAMVLPDNNTNRVNKDGTNDAAPAALQINSATFSPLAQSKRTSTTWFCHYAQIPTLLAKATHVIQKPATHMEEPQIVRYRTGEEFSWHYDEVPATQLENGGQRLGTLLVYLNTVERGGGTMFRDLNDATACANMLTIKPRQGSALLFFPAFADAKADERTLHKGEVAMDEKWIAQMWIHEQDYKPVVPQGNSHEAAVQPIKETQQALGYI